MVSAARILLSPHGTKQQKSKHRALLAGSRGPAATMNTQRAATPSTACCVWERSRSSTTQPFLLKPRLCEREIQSSSRHHLLGDTAWPGRAQTFGRWAWTFQRKTKLDPSLATSWLLVFDIFSRVSLWEWLSSPLQYFSRASSQNYTGKIKITLFWQ